MRVIDLTRRAPAGLVRAAVLGAILSCGCRAFDFDREVVAINPAVMSKGPEAATANEVKLQLGARFFLPGQPISAELHVGKRTLHNQQLFIAVSSMSIDGDAELVPLRRSSTNPEWYLAEPKIAVVESVGSRTVGNARLELLAGEQFNACFMVTANYVGFEDLAGQAVCTSEPASLTSLTSATPPVNPALQLPTTSAAEAIKPAGTLFPRGSLPVQIATHELLAWLRDERELARFLEQAKGKELERFPLTPVSDANSAAFVVRVQIEPSKEEAARLEGTLAFLGREPVVASNWEVHALVNRVLELKLAGWTVSVNPRLEPHGPPRTDPLESLSGTMLNAPSGCIPGDAKVPCILDVEAAWAYMELWDQDTPVNAAVLDRGFATNADFRAAADADVYECALVESGEPVCEAGAAQGAATSEAGSPWHGTGVVEVLAGVLANGQYTAGVAGQVAVPMLYELGALSYGFELGAALKHATDHGASVLNLSAGYPCHALADIGPDLDSCSDGGRANICRAVNESLKASAAATCAAGPALGLTSATRFGVDQLCAAAAGRATFVNPACTGAERIDNAHSPLREGIVYASQRGVPVVVSAGNAIRPGRLPDAVLAEIEPEDWLRVEQLQMIPALYPEPIVVGAVDKDTLDNLELSGDRIDLWAPVGSRWFAPETADIGSPVTEQPELLAGTSAAAPFVSGAVALMQAINPALDPRSALYPTVAGVTPDDDPRRELVSTLRSLLTADEHGWSNAELVSFGRSDQPQRRHLIDPLALVRAASQEVLPEAVAQGYDASLGYSELRVPDDTAASAAPLTFGVEQTGTILSMPRGAGQQSAQDVDWYRFSMPANPGRPLETSIRITYPAGYGDIFAELRGSETISGQDGQLTLVATGAGRDFTFFVSSPAGEDNVYKVLVDPPAPAVPRLTIVAPSAEDRVTLCGNRVVDLRATAAFTNAPELTVPAEVVTWSSTGTLRGTTGLSTVAVFAPGEHRVRVMAYQDPATADELMIEARPCLPPTVTIDAPQALPGMGVLIATEERDAEERDFARVTFSGTAMDPEDGMLRGSALRWSSTRVDRQPVVEAQLGTGGTIVAVLYGTGCGSATYDIRLTATDSDGNSTTTTLRVVVYDPSLC